MTLFMYYLIYLYVKLSFSLECLSLKILYCLFNLLYCSRESSLSNTKITQKKELIFYISNHQKIIYNSDPSTVLLISNYHMSNVFCSCIGAMSYLCCVHNKFSNYKTVFYLKLLDATKRSTDDDSKSKLIYFRI